MSIIDMVKEDKRILLFILLGLIVIAIGLYYSKLQWDSCMAKFPGDWFYCYGHIS